MLATFANIAETLAATTTPWDAALLNPNPVVVPNSLLTPEEPTSLALAVSGIAILCVYSVMKRWRRPPQASDTVTAQRLSSAERLRRAAA